MELSKYELKKHTKRNVILNSYLDFYEKKSNKSWIFTMWMIDKRANC